MGATQVSGYVWALAREGSVVEILDEAKELTSKTRRVEYGPPEYIFDMIAQLWSAYLGINIDGRDVCWLNALQKSARDKVSRKHDNLLDGIGYLTLAAEISECQPNEHT